MTELMQALSFTQPWATLAATGDKRLETRSWGTHYRGRLAIHAALKFPQDARLLCREEPFYACLERAWHRGPVTNDLPRGKVLAVAELAGCYRLHPDGVRAFNHDDPPWQRILEELAPGRMLAREYRFGDFRTGRFVWALRGARQLAEPLPAKGALSLWDWQSPGPLRYMEEPAEERSQS